MPTEKFIFRMTKNNIIYKIFHLYYDGFRSMKLGRTLHALDHHTDKAVCDIRGAEVVLLPQLPEATR